MLLPAGHDRWDPGRLRDVLIHECAHLVRRDHHVSVMQLVARALFWPLPPVHLMNRELSRAREEVCDNFVLRRGDPVAYARTLLEIAESAPGPACTSPALGLLQGRWRLEDRVAGLLDERRDLMTRVDRRTRALVAALLVAAAGAAAGFRPAGGPVAMGLEEIKARIAEQRKKVPGLRVEYRLKYEPMVEEKLLARWGVAYALANRAEEAAFKGDKTYWHVVQKKEIRGFGSPYEPDPESPPSVQERARRRAEDHLKALRDAGQPDALPRGPVTIKPQELIWAFDGKSYWRREPLSPFPTPVIVETGDSADPAWRNGQFQAPYFEDVGLLFPFGVAAGAASGSHRARLLPSALDAHAYAVSPRSEPVDGADCLVLEGRWSDPASKAEVVDRIWLDARRGLAVLKRETRHGGTLRDLVLNRNLEEVAPGFWLPRECEHRTGTPADVPREYRDRPVLSRVIKVSKIGLEVEDGLFEVEPGSNPVRKGEDR